jgi:hypothetical protein
VTFRNVKATVRDTKGMRDLARLLEVPGREIAALDLAAAPEGSRALSDSTGDDVLDDRARAQYRARIVELQAELDDADAAHDIGRSERAQAELDVLVHELAAATGLGGTARRTGSGAERARKAVTARIGDAIRRLDGVHPALAAHLRNAVQTGTFCSYRPEQPEPWHVER